MRIYQTLRLHSLPEELKLLTDQELDFFLRGAISADRGNTTQRWNSNAALPETDPLDIRRKLIDAWQKAVVEMSHFSVPEVLGDE